MKFYTYDQNNSFGKWDKDMPQYLIIEAKDAEHADDIAVDNGVYFDGCAYGRDCPCCGDRWSRQVKWSEGYDEPMLYGAPPTKEELEDDEYVRIIRYGV